MRILVIATSGLGDTLCLAPMLARLRWSDPQGRIDLLTTQAAAVPFLGPSVDGAILLDPRWMSGAKNMARSLWRARSVLARSGPYDLALVAFPSGHWAAALLARFSGAGRRLGFAYPEGAARRSVRWLTGAVDSSAEHLIDRNLDLAAVAGATGPAPGFELALPEAPGAPALGAGNGPLVAFHLGGGFKRWPFESFLALGRMLLEARACRICLVGGEPDREDSDRMQDRLGLSALNFAARLTLSETAQVLKRCRLLVAPDTGLSHLAAGLGLPVLALFGPTADRRYAPRGAHCQVLERALPCRPCYVAPTRRPFSCAFTRRLACLAELDPRTVFEAADRILGRSVPATA